MNEKEKLMVDWFEQGLTDEVGDVGEWAGGQVGCGMVGCGVVGSGQVGWWVVGVWVAYLLLPTPYLPRWAGGMVGCGMWGGGLLPTSDFLPAYKWDAFDLRVVGGYVEKNPDEILLKKLRMDEIKMKMKRK